MRPLPDAPGRRRAHAPAMASRAFFCQRPATAWWALVAILAALTVPDVARADSATVTTTDAGNGQLVAGLHSAFLERQRVDLHYFEGRDEQGRLLDPAGATPPRRLPRRSEHWSSQASYQPAGPALRQGCQRS